MLLVLRFSFPYLLLCAFASASLAMTDADWERRNAGLEQAASIGRAAYIGTAIFVIAGIFEILDIASEIVIWAFILVFGAVCLALALAFGLGGRVSSGSSTMSRAAATINRRTADSAFRRIPITWRWSGLDIRSIVTPSESPIIANSFKTSTKRGARLRSMANLKSIPAQ